MQEVTELHREAMALFERALICKSSGDFSGYKRYINEAFIIEKNAAIKIEKEALEPTRSILLRSAASIALQCDLPREAEILISKALSGDPPSEIAEELRDLLEEANFKRHLALRGVELVQDEFQLSLAGDAIAYGLASSNAFLERIKWIKSMVQRTGSRLAGRSFEESLFVKDETDTELYISVPQAASFAVRLRLGVSKQMKLPDVDRGPKIVDEIMDCMDLYSKNDIGLKNKISDHLYYSNFVALARSIAPDGQNIKLVGFTSYKGKQKRDVFLNKPRNEYIFKTDEYQEKGRTKIVKLRGILRFADGISERSHTIKIIDKSKRVQAVEVPLEMMHDIVKPLWESEVVITGEQNIDRRRKSPAIKLVRIDKAE
jgi:hypothetical protein